MLSQGVPVTLLFVFTVLIWCLYGMIFASSPGNKVNQWCCIGGMILSLGVLKEYIYYGGVLAGKEIILRGIRYPADDLMNSIMTAVLYYCSMPCAVVCSLYFCRMDRRFPHLFRVVQFALFIPALVFSGIYPWSETRNIVYTSSRAYGIVAVYNLLYGVFATVPAVVSLFRERKNYAFRQRRLIFVIVLLPLWYWLVTIFLVHLLKLEMFYKAWQGNIVIILLLFLYYLYHLFHRGIWGMRLSREYFDWSGDGSCLSEETKYILHMMKNELAKLKISSMMIREQGNQEADRELDIIDRSVAHMEEFVRKSVRCSGAISISPVPVNVRELFETVTKECAGGWGGKIQMVLDPHHPEILCDYAHMKEVLNNMVSNALEAMGDTGTLTLTHQMRKKTVNLIQIKDTGHGIDRRDRIRIFDLYYTTKKDPRHFGIGLSYCFQAVKAHGGCIRVKSSADPERHGTEFTIVLPGNIRNGMSRGK